MRKKDVFTISIYEKYNFLNDDEIQKIISSMKPEDFMEHGSIEGNAKSTYRAHENNHFFLDNHKWLEEKIGLDIIKQEQKWFVKHPLLLERIEKLEKDVKKLKS